MTKNFILFDMDGVLLSSCGYHKALRTSVERVADALGTPGIFLREDQIAQFEALNITNEWDSLAICAALLLVEIWKTDPHIRLNGTHHHKNFNLSGSSIFDHYLDTIPQQGPYPGEFAYEKICSDHPWLDSDQQKYLNLILSNCRDIYLSPTLPAHQELVLGSDLFQKTYALEPKLNTDGLLFLYDTPILTPENHDQLRRWLNQQENFAGIMTNRQSSAPDGHLSPPEAEIGVQLIKFANLPMLGSGILTWYAASHRNDQTQSFLKPHPLHALGLLQMMTGETVQNALDKAYDAWLGKGKQSDWNFLDGSTIWVFEDSAKGLLSCRSACEIMNQLGISVSPALIGVTEDPIKRKALEGIADTIIQNINQFDWDSVF